MTADSDDYVTGEHPPFIGLALDRPQRSPLPQMLAEANKIRAAATEGTGLQEQVVALQAQLDDTRAALTAAIRRAELAEANYEMQREGNEHKTHRIEELEGELEQLQERLNDREWEQT